MRKPDDELKLDITEIFGDDWTKETASPQAEVPLPPAEPEAKEEVLPDSDIKFNDLSSAPVVEPMVLSVKSGHSSDFDFMMASAASTPPGNKTDSVNVINENQVENLESSMIVKAGTSAKSSATVPEDFFSAYDRFREIFMEELKDLAGTRKINVMLVKTFEAAREKYPEVFHNANWDTDGNLLDDGSLNTHRMLTNKSALDEKQADIILDTALVSLLNLRLQAVEKGLGSEYSTRIRARLKNWLSDAIQKNGLGKDDPKILRRLSNYLL
jgi:hypothetical protein